QILQDDDYRAIKDAGHKEQFLLIPKANKVLDEALDSEDLNIALKAASAVHKNTGMQPSHTQTMFVQNLYLDQRTYSTPEQIQDTARLLGSSDVQVMDLENVDNMQGMSPNQVSD
ncbi:MAG: hypothetical protein RTU92_01045, partial [Candidatus Thorarchaeota archaeon]